MKYDFYDLADPQKTILFSIGSIIEKNNPDIMYLCGDFPIWEAEIFYDRKRNNVLVPIAPNATLYQTAMTPPVWNYRCDTIPDYYFVLAESKNEMPVLFYYPL